MVNHKTFKVKQTIHKVSCPRCNFISRQVQYFKGRNEADYYCPNCCESFNFNFEIARLNIIIERQRKHINQLQQQIKNVKKET